MKFLLLYLALAVPIGYLFGEEEYERISQMQEISKAPAFAPAKFEELITTKSKKIESYRVRFSYVVNGEKYKVISTRTDQQGAMRYITETNQVAYNSRNPSVGTLKRYYDLRRPDETLAQAMFVVSISALLLALPAALLVAWKFGWLKRKGKMRSQPSN